MDMRTRIPINVTIDPEVIKELDHWLGQQPYKLTRAAFIETSVKRQLADEKSKKGKK